MTSSEVSFTFDPEVLADLQRAQREGDGRPTVMLAVFDGALDAGHASHVVLEHVAEHGNPRTVGWLNADDFVDQRSRRPAVTFDNGMLSDLQMPEYRLDALTDERGRSFLVLHGPEPDYRWNAFGDAVVDAVDALGVGFTVFVHGIPVGVPHTRPAGATVSATRADLVSAPFFEGAATLPATISSALQVRLGEELRNAVTYAVHVPMYLSQSRYAPAALTAVERMAGLTGLELWPDDLAVLAAEAVDEVERQVAGNAQVKELIAALERQYDAVALERRHPDGADGADQAGASQDHLGPMVTFEDATADTETGAPDGASAPDLDAWTQEIERFLADQDSDPGDESDRNDGSEPGGAD